MEKQVFAMIHVQALPGTPANCLTVDQIIAHAEQEATQLLEAGFDGLLIENMHDVPYLNREVGPEIVACMTGVSRAVRALTDKPIGIQILAGANKAALAVAQAAGLNFIRAEGFVYGHVADEGYMDAQAGELLRYRKQIGAEAIELYVDVKKKHAAHSITSDVSLNATIEAAEFFLCDGIIVSGEATGKAVDFDELKDVQTLKKTTCLLGSGITAENIGRYWPYADGFIVGSYIKKKGLWSEPLDKKNIASLMHEVNHLKQSYGE